MYISAQDLSKIHHQCQFFNTQFMIKVGKKTFIILLLYYYYDYDYDYNYYYYHFIIIKTVLPSTATDLNINK